MPVLLIKLSNDHKNSYSFNVLVLVLVHYLLHTHNTYINFNTIYISVQVQNFIKNVSVNYKIKKL